MQEKQTMVGKLYLTPGYHSERRRFAKKAALFMILTALFLALASFAARLSVGLLSELTSSYVATNAIEVVDVSNEGSIPTWFSSSVLLLCAILLAVIASAERAASGGYATHWRALSVIFLLLSLDEVAQFHDKTGRFLMSEFSFGSVFHFAWVVPGSVFVLFVLLAYLKFLLALPTRTRWLFVVAGAIYVGGALGTEMIGGRHVELYGESTVWYLALMTIEEFLEMAGAVTFFYALMVYEGSLRKDTKVGLPDERTVLSLPRVSR